MRLGSPICECNCQRLRTSSERDEIPISADPNVAILRMPKPPDSISLNRFRHVACISLKQKTFKTGSFQPKPKSALGAVARFPIYGFFSAAYREIPCPKNRWSFRIGRPTFRLAIPGVESLAPISTTRPGMQTKAPGAAQISTMLSLALNWAALAIGPPHEYAIACARRRGVNFIRCRPFVSPWLRINPVPAKDLPR